MPLDRDMRIEARDRRRGAVDFRISDIGGGVDDLPLQVRERDQIVIDDAERADAGGREIIEHRRTEPAGADHQDARTFQRGLARTANLAQHDMAGITLEFRRLSAWP